jgi:hypothetical protein
LKLVVDEILALLVPDQSDVKLHAVRSEVKTKLP